jgi:hypothetical protein
LSDILRRQSSPGEFGDGLIGGDGEVGEEGALESEERLERQAIVHQLPGAREGRGRMGESKEREGGR